MMQAPVNKIIPFSNVDGPGNRCAIFFQSCPFSCLYCHNPETIHMCSHCGACVETCPVQALQKEQGKVVWNQDICIQCDTCIHICPNMASPKIRYMNVSELINEVQKMKGFIRGITVSGGECMNQSAFLLELFQEVKKLGLTCLIDSNGYYDFSLYPELMEVCDGVMLDIKAVDANFHHELTGCDNSNVLKNLDYLLEQGKLEEVRTVILPGFDEQNERTVRYVSERLGNQSRYKLIRYRKYGVRDEGLQIIGDANTTQEYIQQYKNICEKNGNTTSIII